MERRPRLLITAGPTHEPIDAVRYVGNRSSGRMGLALAEAAAERSLPTTLLLGPTQLPEPDSSQVRTIRFQTAAELGARMQEQWPAHDVLIMAAAVADFRPRAPMPDAKLGRSTSPLTMVLEPTPDLLASLQSITRADQIVIGFALEPQAELRPSALDKLRRKRLDAIVANPLETMDSEQITATLFFADGRSMEPASGLSKREFAGWLLDQALSLHQSRSPGI